LHKSRSGNLSLALAALLGASAVMLRHGGVLALASFDRAKFAVTQLQQALGHRRSTILRVADRRVTFGTLRRFW